jgi:hypothetical protein
MQNLSFAETSNSISEVLTSAKFFGAQAEHHYKDTMVIMSSTFTMVIMSSTFTVIRQAHPLVLIKWFHIVLY